MTEKNNSLTHHLVSLIVITTAGGLFILAGIILTALFSFDPNDPAWSHNNGGDIQNTLGVVGAWYSDLSFSIIGKLAYLMPIGFIAIAVNVLVEKKIDKELLSWRLFALVTGILSGCVLWAKHDLESINTVAQTGGGALGMWLVIGLEKSIHSVPVIMFFALVVFIISITLLFNLPWLKIAEFIGTSITRVLGLVFSGLAFSQDKKDTVANNAEDKSFTNEAPIPNAHVQKQVDIVEELAAKEISIPTPVQEPHDTEQRSFTIDRYTPDDEDETMLPPRYESTIDAPINNPEDISNNDSSILNDKKISDDNILDLSAFGLAPPKKKKPKDENQDLQVLDTNNRSSSLLNTPTSSHGSAPQNSIPLYDFSANEKKSAAQESVLDQKEEPSFFNFNQTRKPHVKIRENDASEIINDSYDYLSQQQTESIPSYESDFEKTLQAFDKHNSYETSNFDVAPSVPEQPYHNVEDTIAKYHKEDEAIISVSHEQAAKLTDTDINNSVNYGSTFTENSTPTFDNNTVEQSLEHDFSDEREFSQYTVPSASISKPEVTAIPQPAPTKQIDSVQSMPAQTSESLAPVKNVVEPEQTTSATIGKAFDKEELTDIVMERPHEFPSIELLDTPPPQENAYTEDVLAQMATVLENTLKQFNVVATVMHVSPGPVITRFEVDLAPGIQAKKITNLSQDLARALAVSRVRVEEVIVGSSYVGLEVPNQSREIVYFKDVVRSKAFQNSKSPLTISLGSDTSGKPVVADLMKMPHALVAGTTGSGKSVCINVMLLSMLYKASPKDLRLILVDPKMLEMSMYEDIPHLLTPVITDMNEAENALTWAVAEMERRYQLMAALKVRKIDAFNEHVDRANACGEPIKDPLWQPDEQVGYTHHPDLERLPFIVIVIDELADMMMVVGKQVEQLIARLTQKARAAGIHVVLATQRPSTDVLTGLIKANVPTRIAFQVSSGTDSRVIIDSVGAEKLLGHGDMLFVPPGASHPQRLHGAFVGDAETDRITDFLRSTGEPNYIDGIIRKQDPESLGAFGAAEAAESKEDADPLYQEAVQLVLQSGKASISSVQRQLRIGYNRAARMIEDMQEQGIVSEPVNGVRKVLAAPLPKDSI